VENEDIRSSFLVIPSGIPVYLLFFCNINNTIHYFIGNEVEYSPGAVTPSFVGFSCGYRDINHTKKSDFHFHTGQIYAREGKPDRYPGG
jgi:hypothetical protein